MKAPGPIKAILFDLDDTLLYSNMNTFLPHYFRALTARLAPLVPPDRLVPQLLASTQVMMANRDRSRTNQEVFVTDFFPKIGLAEDVLAPVFAAFYTHDFPRLRGLTRPRPEARPLLESLLAAGYQLAIATQPVFPLTAIRQRLEWAGIGDLPFAWITSYETSHACKPAPAFFQEILERLGRAPADCLMVGNDGPADLDAAAQLGLLTYWITDSESSTPPRRPATGQGSLEALQGWLEKHQSPAHK